MSMLDNAVETVVYPSSRNPEQIGILLRQMTVLWALCLIPGSKLWLQIALGPLLQLGLHPMHPHPYPPLLLNTTTT